MITDKQKQRDYEYNGDYQTKSKYTAEQWTNILKSGQIKEEDIEILKEIYASFNHAATLLQLSFHHNISKDQVLAQMNQIGETLGKVNDLKPEVDFSGNEYWWYLCFWGKENKETGLELKMQPELTEAIAELYPELEEKYYTYANDVERSMQIRYNPEDSVWIASAVLLYEKYYCNPGISADDILLMQYEIQTRAQKVYGQDVHFNTITKTCNSDERGHRYNYLRDIYKYYRVTFPGEMEGDLERPDPENIDYNAYVYSIFGYMTLNQLYDFVSHEYAYLVDESYVELTNANGFVRLAAFVTRQGGKAYDKNDGSDQGIATRADGLDAENTFHLIGDALLKEYPNFTYAKKASWYDDEAGKIAARLHDVLYIENYSQTGASIAISTVPEGDAVHIEVSLNLPVIANEECMLDIQDKCNMLTLMTAAPFKVEKTLSDAYDLGATVQKIKASVLYQYSEFQTMKEEDIIGMMGTALQIFASYYTDICQNYYPAQEVSIADSFAAALGDKFKVRPSGGNVPGPNVIYKQGATSPTADYIVNVLQNTIGGQNEGQTATTEYEEEEEFTTAGTNIGKKINLLDEEEGVVKKVTDTSKLVIPDPIPQAPASSSSAVAHGGGASMGMGGSGLSSSASAGNARTGGGSAGPNAGAGMAGMDGGANAAGMAGMGNARSASAAMGTPIYMTAPTRPKVPKKDHADRRDQSFRLYPKNTMIQGPVKTGKYHEAMTTAVGIIEGKDSNMMSIEPVPDILENYRKYVEEKRILHISYPDIAKNGYEGWIESKGPQVQDGIFKNFANACGEGRYVVMMEDVDFNWMHLFGETSVLLRANRREGTSSETTVTLFHSGETFQLPSNLYIIATCDSIVCEDTILGAINQDFFIRQIAADSSVLKGMRVEGILLERLMATLNLRISYFLGPQYQLGEGFFLGSADKDPFISLCRVFREQLIPVLETWFDGDMERIRYVLGDNAKTRQDTIFYRETPYRNGLFKGNLPDDFDKERHIYQINDAAFYNPKSYIDIYE